MFPSLQEEQDKQGEGETHMSNATSHGLTIPQHPHQGQEFQLLVDPLQPCPASLSSLARNLKK
jgi:hypothetical protein